MQRTVLWIALCSLCLCSSTSFSASPRDEILRLVPEDAGFCVLVQDLRGTIERLQSSPFAARLADSPMGQSFRASPEARRLAAINEQLTGQLGVTAQELRDDVFGDAFALSYTPGPLDKPELGQGLLLIHARRPEKLAALLKRLNETQTESGELRAVEPRSAGGQSYTVRHKPDGDEFYAISGSVFILSNTESRVTAALELARQPSPAVDEPSALLRRLQSLGVESDQFVVWINPRAFDSAIEQQVRSAGLADAGAMATFSACWHALDGAALTVRLDDSAAVGLTVRGRSDALPPDIRRLFDNLRRPAAVWKAFPDGALLTAAGRVPWEPAPANTAPALGKYSIKDAWERGISAIIGREMLPELLRLLGPDWGFCVERPDASSPSALPAFTAAVRLHEGSAAVRQRVLGGLDVIARLGVLAFNAQYSTQLKVQKTGDELGARFIDAGSALPPGIQPAFAWKGGYIVLASSPDAIRRFQPPAETDPPTTTEEQPLLRLAFTGWAGYLRSYKQPLVNYVADSHKLDRAEVRQRLDRLLESLELFDRLEVTQRVSSGRATVTLRLRTSQPLRK